MTKKAQTVESVFQSDSPGKITDSKKLIRKEALTGFSSLNFQTERSYSNTYYQVAMKILNESHTISGLKMDDPIPLDGDEHPVLLEDVIRFYSNPIRWFLTRRFDLSLKEITGENDEFTLDHLEEHRVFQHIFNWQLHGKDVQTIQKYLVETGSVPTGWAGERKVLGLKYCASEAINLLKSEAIDPVQEYYPISVTVDTVELEGSITSYSKNQFVDITPSRFSGKIALQSWIRHLCCLASELFVTNRSLLLCELKKGEPKKKIFRPVSNPKDILTDLVHFYQEGLASPKLFFPKTLYAFEEKQRDGNVSAAYYQAAKAFNSGKYSYGENSDLAVKTLLGESIEFRNDFITERYRRIIRTMIDHMGDS